MHSQTLRLVNRLALLTFISMPSTFAAMEVANSTVPEPCKAICNPVVELTNTCNVDPMSGMNMESMKAGDMVMSPEEEAKSEADCICTNKSFDVKAVMGLCASCMGQNDQSGNTTSNKGMDFIANFLLANDINVIMSKCAFPSTSYAPSATTILAGISVQATMPAMTVVAGNSSSPSSSAMSGMSGGTSMGQIGAAGRVEVATGVWGVGMLMVSVGLGAGMLFGML